MSVAHLAPVKVSIIFPTTGRAERAAECLKRLLPTIDGFPVEIVAVIDADPVSRDAVQAILQGKRYQLDYSDTRRGGCAAWNRGLELAQGSYIVLAADDLVFHAGWLDESLKVMETLPDRSGLVSFNDGHHDGRALGTHYLLSRQFIIDHLGGRIAWPCYVHSFQDVEANERAKRVNRYAWAERALVTHEHWTFGSRTQDDTDRAALGGHAASARAYELRRAMDFPDDYPAVIGPKKPEKTRIGYLVDIPPYAGGAEMSAKEMADLAPESVELVPCPPGSIAPDCAAYVLHNCTEYSMDDAEIIRGKPFVKLIHDEWPHSDADWRRFILDNALLLFFSSPLHRDTFRWSYTARAVIEPVIMPVAPYEAAARSANGNRRGTVWINRMYPGKGMGNAMNWAKERGVAIDFYGFGPMSQIIQPPHRYLGPLAQADVPAMLARYEQFVFLPDAVEPFSRTTAEAYFAGLRIVGNKNIGALHWLQNCPEAIAGAAARKWAMILEVARG